MVERVSAGGLMNPQHCNFMAIAMHRSRFATLNWPTWSCVFHLFSYPFVFRPWWGAKGMFCHFSSEFIRFALQTPSKSFGKYVFSLSNKVSAWYLLARVIKHNPCVWWKWCTYLYIAEKRIVNSLHPSIENSAAYILQRQIESHRPTDSLVYELYGLTEEDIGIFEED